MNDENKKCPKCGGEMEHGKMLPGVAGFDGSIWYNGKRNFFGVASKMTGVSTYKCIQCGYLESYAK